MLNNTQLREITKRRIRESKLTPHAFSDLIGFDFNRLFYFLNFGDLRIKNFVHLCRALNIPLDDDTLQIAPEHDQRQNILAVINADQNLSDSERKLLCRLFLASYEFWLNYQNAKDVITENSDLILAESKICEECKKDLPAGTLAGFVCENFVVCVKCSDETEHQWQEFQLMRTSGELWT